MRNIINYSLCAEIAIGNDDDDDGKCHPKQIDLRAE